MYFCTIFGAQILPRNANSARKLLFRKYKRTFLINISIISLFLIKIRKGLKSLSDCFFFKWLLKCQKPEMNFEMGDHFKYWWGALVGHNIGIGSWLLDKLFGPTRNINLFLGLLWHQSPIVYWLKHTRRHTCDIRFLIHQLKMLILLKVCLVKMSE